MGQRPRQHNSFDTDADDAPSTHIVDAQPSAEPSPRRLRHDKLDLLVALGVELEHGARALSEAAEQVGEEPEKALGGRVRGRVGVAEPLEDRDAGEERVSSGGLGKDGKGTNEIAPSKEPGR